MLTPAAERRPARRWKRRKDARPDELVAAALELFVARGYAATRLEDVACRAGVSKGTLYLYFENKEELFKAVVRQALLPAIVEAERLVMRHQGSARELVRLIVRRWWTLIGATRAGGLPKLVVSECGNFPELARFYFDEVIERARAMIGQALKRGMQRGEFRPLKLEYAVQVTVAPVVFLAIWLYSFHGLDPRRLDPEKYLDTYLEILFDGLAGEGSHDQS